LCRNENRKFAITFSNTVKNNFMQHFEIKGEKRTDLGKNASRKLRKLDSVPCVLYGCGENVNFSATRAELRNLIYSHNVYIVDIKIGKKKYQAIMKDIQYDPISSKVNHIDFLELSDDKPVAIHVPLIINGQSIGVKAGGKLKKNQRLMHIKALPSYLPDIVEVDITDLNLNDSIRVKDVVIENVELLDQKNKVLVTIVPVRGVETAAPAAE